jgi:hypothetical protein
VGFLLQHADRAGLVRPLRSRVSADQCLPGARIATVSVDIATGISKQGATLNGTANPNGVPTTAYFQYGLTTGYGSATSVVSLGAGSTFVAIGNGAITGLACSKLYHFRAVAASSAGTTVGPDATFTTAPCNSFGGDLDSDGKTDFGVYRPSTGECYVLRSSTGYTTWLTQQWGATTDIPIQRR